jgi:hypothetical protein
VRTPKILTLTLLVPAVTLLLTAAFHAIAEASAVRVLELASNDGTLYVEQERGVNPLNCWLAGAGGVLALGAIGAGLWWRQRRLELTRLKRELDAESLGTEPRGPTLALRVGAGSAGLVLRGRL